MKSFFLFFSLFSICWGGLYNPQGGPSDSLLIVLDRFGIRHNGTWESIQQETERAWLKGREIELWELPPCTDSSPQETYALFTPLGMTQSIYASCCYYKYAVVLGATETIVRKRFLFLKAEWERGVRFEKLIILIGDRPLADFEKSDAKNETEMIKQLFQELDLPQEWKDRVEFIDTPRPEGSRRPHTHHTFEQWLSAHPPAGAALIVSNQPFVYRQGAIAHLYLPYVEPIGEGFSVDELKGRTQILLAELAQWIKVECQTASASASSSFSNSPCLYER